MHLYHSQFPRLPIADDNVWVPYVLRLLFGMQNERVLFHYNGHGVPRPTVNGEIWVFNKSYTQYIPMSIYDLQAWLGTPCIFVFDCSAAGLIVNSFKAFAEQKTQVGLLPPTCSWTINTFLEMILGSVMCACTEVL